MKATLTRICSHPKYFIEVCFFYKVKIAHYWSDENLKIKRSWIHDRDCTFLFVIFFTATASKHLEEFSSITLYQHFTNFGGFVRSPRETEIAFEFLTHS